ncbi:MAG: hypothetical protein E6K71_03660 [Candidatus Eisenbacteria bacterium]|uniref:Uncharacterized protein n=1 Tax=Eiseniibacteriota bacterium TaxID=2212470 RepID=A0A538SEU9_UNCEI|nr:MAG: hypothetical protein E6K71_03660 [Candidatus Eisenbacteria bacterium]
MNLRPALRASEFRRAFKVAARHGPESDSNREAWTAPAPHRTAAVQLQRKLQFAGLNAMVLPVRVLQSAT